MSRRGNTEICQVLESRALFPKEKRVINASFPCQCDRNAGPFGRDFKPKVMILAVSYASVSGIFIRGLPIHHPRFASVQGSLDSRRADTIKCIEKACLGQLKPLPLGNSLRVRTNIDDSPFPWLRLVSPDRRSSVRSFPRCVVSGQDFGVRQVWTFLQRELISVVVVDVRHVLIATKITVLGER